MEQFVLHWKSVRPVPRITVDYGDGRTLQGTITGNSIHYILDSRGRLVDALPGLYGAGFFLENLEVAGMQARHFTSLEDKTYTEALGWYHTTALALRGMSLDPPGGLETLLAHAPTSSREIPIAIEAGKNALSKSRVETPVLKGVTRGAETKAPAEPYDWASLAERDRARWKLSDTSRQLVLEKHQAALGVSNEGVLESFERVLGLDAVRNEYLLHTVLNAWLAVPLNAVPDLSAFNDRVYAELFLTPKSDPWLGLRSPETYLALAPVGEGAR